MGKKDKRRRAAAVSAELAATSAAPASSLDAPPDWVAALTGRAGRRLIGARMCFGKPVHNGGVTVVPVAAVRGLGGAGWGSRADAPGSGGGAVRAAPPPAPEGAGGGGYLHARPLGFIEIGPQGARYQSLGRPGLRVPVLSAGLALLGGVLTGRALAGRGRSGRSHRSGPSRRRSPGSGGRGQRRGRRLRD